MGSLLVFIIFRKYDYQGVVLDLSQLPIVLPVKTSMFFYNLTLSQHYHS